MATRRGTAILLLAALFLFRLIYGLSMPFWFEDERQVYLIGLQSFARHEWPYFGADLVWTGGQLPGALLGWLIRLPLEIWPAPEAPFVLLNLLSFGALALLAWYLRRRLPLVPGWLIWWSLLTLPWTLNFSTHLVNPSYAIAGAIVFFVGFFEAMPGLSRRIVPFSAAWSMMGAGLLWVMQLHMSWVLLVPYAAAAFVAIASCGSEVYGLGRVAALARAVGMFAAGAIVPGSLLIPTILKYGWDAGHAQAAIVVHQNSPLEIVRTTARVLSFAAFEVPRFLGMSSAERVLAMTRHPVIAITVVPVLIAGLLQPLWTALLALSQFKPGRRDWRDVRLLLAATIGLIFVSYFFSIRGPQAHSFYLVFPVSALFAFTCWNEQAAARGSRLRVIERVAVVVLALNVAMHAALAVDRWHRQSLYVDRPLVVAAIDGHNDRYLGDRRDTLTATQSHDPRPIDGVTDMDGFRNARATDDLRITSARWLPWRGIFSAFSIAVDNRSQVAAWLDIRFRVTYKDAAGTVIESREIVVKQILQPGAQKSWLDVADGYVPAGATDATLAIAGAEKAIPVPY